MDMQSNKDDRIITQTQVERSDDRSKRKILPIIAVVAALGGFYFVVSYAYNKGAEQGVENLVPTISADADAFKVEPENPGGVDVPFRETLVFDQLDPDSKTDINKVESILPPPEDPVEISTDSLEEAEIMAKEEASKAKSVDVKEGIEKIIAPPVEETKKVEEAKKDVTEALDDVLETVEKLEKKVEETAPEATAKVTEKVTPVSKEAVKKEVKDEVKSVNVIKDQPKLAAGTSRVQLAAFKNEEAATTEWKKLSKKYAPLLDAQSYDVERADLGDKGIFYRLHVAKLSKEAAKDLCEQIKAKKGSCLVK